MQVNTYLDDETNNRLSAVARERGESRNMLMLRAVREWLSRQDKEESAGRGLEPQGLISPQRLPTETARF